MRLRYQQFRVESVVASIEWRPPREVRAQSDSGHRHDRLSGTEWRVVPLVAIRAAASMRSRYGLSVATATAR